MSDAIVRSVAEPPAPLSATPALAAGTGGPDLDGGDEEGGLDFGRILAALRRFWWLPVLSTVVGGVGGVVATRFLKPEYTVQGTVFVQQSDQSTGPIRPGELLQTYGWVQLVQSYAVLDTVVLRERLYLRPASPADSAVFADFDIGETVVPGEYAMLVGADNSVTLERTPGIVVERGTLGDSIGRAVGFRWVPRLPDGARERKVAFTVATPRQAANAVRSVLRVGLSDEQGSFIKLSLTDTDPSRAQRTLNSVLDQFTSVAATLKRYKLTEQSKVLGEQLTSMEQRLRRAEQDLEAYRTRIITLPGEAVVVQPGIANTQPQALTQYFGQKTELDQLRRQRMELEYQLSRARGGELLVDGLLSLDVVRQAPDLSAALTEYTKVETELRGLREKYTDLARPVQDALRRADSLRTGTIPQAGDRLLTVMRDREEALEQRIAGQTRELQNIPSRTITEQRLTREVAGLAALYQEVQARYQQARLAEASAIPDVRVLDRPMAPDRPDRQRAPMVVGVAILGGLGAGLALAILLDRLDRRFRYPDQVDRELGLPILGAVPTIGDTARRGAPDDGEVLVLEAFRALRTNVVAQAGAARPITLAVTSPGPGEGKSFVASNLALSFAEAGQRALLVDGDIRRGALHHLLKVERQPGLVDVLLGSARPEEALRPTHHERMMLLPCGSRDRRGPELLGSAALPALLASLRGQFDVVIVDTAPLGAGIDAAVLAMALHNMLLVMRSGETDRDLAAAKLRELERLPIRLLGAVLNDVSLRDRHYAYYSYVYGYSVDDSEEGEARGVPQLSVGRS